MALKAHRGYILPIRKYNSVRYQWNSWKKYHILETASTCESWVSKVLFLTVLIEDARIIVGVQTTLSGSLFYTLEDW